MVKTHPQVHVLALSPGDPPHDRIILAVDAGAVGYITRDADPEEFSAAIQQGMYGLVVIAVLASAIGIYYYIRVLVLMYMKEPEGEIESLGIPGVARVVILIMVLGTLYLGVLPGSVLKMASEAVKF